MTECKEIKTDYKELNDILSKLNIKEYINHSVYGPALDYSEIKIEDIGKDGITEIRPIEIRDLISLYLLMKENQHILLENMFKNKSNKTIIKDI